MNTSKISAARSSRAILTAMLLGTSSMAFAQQIVQPGAPGQDSKTLTAEEATQLAKAKYTDADVAFMQGMIVHHEQAVTMAKLVDDRTNNESVVTVAGRILASQADEIEFMREWLTARGEPTTMKGHEGHAGHMHHMMAGMASPAQLEALAAAEGTEFDRQFLTLMIAHHEGAIDMVDDLLVNRAVPQTRSCSALLAMSRTIRNPKSTRWISFWPASQPIHAPGLNRVLPMQAKRS